MADSNPVETKDNDKNKDHLELLVIGPSLLTTIESTPGNTQALNITQENHESVVFIWLDPQDQSGLNLVGPLRAINDNVQGFNNSASCFAAIKDSKVKVFFITTSSHSELITTVHDHPAVEAIFIFAPNVESIKGDFPKLFGIFNQQEELFRVLKDVLDTFEQIQLETFAFEQDKVFLWSQLWKEELISRKGSSKKYIFLEATRQYYRDNMMIIRLIEELDKSYRPAEVISWCLRSPFPSRFIHHALRSHNTEQLNFCRFLFADASRFFQQHPKRKSGEQFYRGMKLSNEILDKFESHVGQLVCTGGFFPCAKSRTNAINVASLSAYRLDLSPVLFKINCDVSSLYTEIANRYFSPMIVFDICTTFRIVYINRGPMTVIKMKTAGENGKKIAKDYLEQHKDETIQSLLDELMKPPKPPTPPKPATPIPSPTKRPSLKPTSTSNQTSDQVLSPEETKAQRYVARGEIDRALAVYQRIKPANARVLNAIGNLCADKKGDYHYALKCHTQALKIQEEDGEDIADTLTDLGNVYHSFNEYDLALGCHTRAAILRQSHQSPDQASVASNLIGIANAHWSRREYPEAIDNTQRALAIRESLLPLNEASVAATLAMLGNIYQDSGNIGLAMDLCKKALVLFERTLPADSPILAELFYSLGTMQLNMELLDDAYHSFERVVKIYRKILPQGHPDRIAAENDLRRVIHLHQKKMKRLQQQS